MNEKWQLLVPAFVGALAVKGLTFEDYLALRVGAAKALQDAPRETNLDRFWLSVNRQIEMHQRLFHTTNVVSVQRFQFNRDDGCRDAFLSYLKNDEHVAGFFESSIGESGPIELRIRKGR